MPRRPRSEFDVFCREATSHPATALLVVEVADTSLAEDRLTKAPIYAGAGVAECWIVNLRASCIEVRRSPNPARRRYESVTTCAHGDRIELVALPGVSVSTDDLLPAPSV